MKLTVVGKTLLIIVATRNVDEVVVAVDLSAVHVDGSETDDVVWLLLLLL